MLATVGARGEALLLVQVSIRTPTNGANEPGVRTNPANALRSTGGIAQRSRFMGRRTGQ